MTEILESFVDGRQFAFDNTSLSIFKDCPRKYELTVLQGWRPKTEAPPLVFGKLLHRGLEIYDLEIFSGQPHQIALRLAVLKLLTLTSEKLEDGTLRFWTTDDPTRTRRTLLQALIWYCEHFREDVLKTHKLPDGKPALELSFRFEIPGTHFFYCGHIDKIADYGPHGIFLQERKHTKTTIGSYFFEKYNPNSQVTGYIAAAQVLIHQPVHGAIIDAVQTAVGFARPARGIETRRQEQIDEWLEDTIHWMKLVDEAAQAKKFPMNTESCHKYRGCQFRGVCRSSPGVRQALLETDFVKRFWDPLKIRTGDED